MSPPKMAPDGVQGWFLPMSPVTFGPFSASPWHPKIDQKSISSGKVDPQSGVFPVLRRFSVLGSFVGLFLVNFRRKFDVFSLFFLVPSCLFCNMVTPTKHCIFTVQTPFFIFAPFQKFVKKMFKIPVNIISRKKNAKNCTRGDPK